MEMLEALGYSSEHYIVADLLKFAFCWGKTGNTQQYNVESDTNYVGSKKGNIVELLRIRGHEVLSQVLYFTPQSE